VKIGRSWLTWTAVFFLIATAANAKSNFVKINLPNSVSIDLPNNWVLLSENKRITLDTWNESTFDLHNLKEFEIDSSFPFAANYYIGGVTAGIINARFYPDSEISQNDVKRLSAPEVFVIDQVLQKQILPSMMKIGIEIVSWEGSTLRTINGLSTIVTEYHRKSMKHDGVFRVRLIRVLAGKRSFTLTVSYMESQALLVKNITERIISSLKMEGYK